MYKIEQHEEKKKQEGALGLTTHRPRKGGYHRQERGMLVRWATAFHPPLYE